MEIEILIQNSNLKGDLEIPSGVETLVILANSSSKDRLSNANLSLSNNLQKMGVATFCFDLLTEEEELKGKSGIDLDLLSERLIAVTKWCVENEKTKLLRIAYVGFGTSAAAALSASAYWGTKIKAVVSIAGRPDLAIEVLDLIESPTLLVVGSEDRRLIDFNKQAYQKMGCVKKTEIVSGSSNMLDTEEEVKKVSELVAAWMIKFLIT